jgi:hypothetical protein
MIQSLLDKHLTTDPREEGISWGELAQLTHATQVAGFGFCLCEDLADDQETPFTDCPTSKAEPTYNDLQKQLEEGVRQ